MKAMHSPSSILPFILLTEKLKLSDRVTRIIGSERRENSAEHSWQVALLALILADFSNEKIDILKVLKMFLIHDLPEAICGDVPLYAENRNEAIHAEEKAAKEIFSMLPESLNNELDSLWHEFNERKSPEAKFCACIDRLMPFIQNLYGEGKSWKEFNVTKEMATMKSKHAEQGSKEIWEFMKELLNQGVEKGFLREE